MNMTVLFPGQGSQKAGMGRDLAEAFPCASARFEQANDIIGRDVRALCFDGPEEELKLTANTQPALFTVEAAACDVLKEQGGSLVFAAGHSLGEYAALYAAGVYSFEDGLRLVARRGELMGAAGEKKPGAMAAIIGMSVDEIGVVLSRVTSGIVVPANQNTPEQTVISGEIDAVNEACELLKQAGAKRAIVLPVSGAFHSPLMQDVADEFKGYLADITFRDPACPVISNVTAQPETSGERLRELLVQQLVSPVRWVETVGFIESAECGTCCEVGPQSVLKGLVGKCCRDLKVVSFGTAENVFSLFGQ